jgi:ribosomal protein S18 acetylase RimI-like enzyme
MAIIEALNQHNLALDTAAACFLDPPEVLARENSEMIGVFRDLEESGVSAQAGAGDVPLGHLCGIGAVKFFDDYGEIKRMFVKPEFRGLGLSHLIMDDLLARIESRGLPHARLETGADYKAAVGLYASKGFKERLAFGDYPQIDTSLFMERPMVTNREQVASNSQG